MKKFFLLAAILAITTLGFAQEPQKNSEKAELRFEKQTHNFGIIAQDTAVVTYEFVFKNVGKSPLIIHQANASCGCTVPEYTLEPIMPGEKGKLKVTYNGVNRRPGVFRKSITVHNNGRRSPVRVYIEGEMVSNISIEDILLQQDSTLYIDPTIEEEK
ncbi:MAG: DUF1573 domain-containing protein [Bacteroidales bacterium]|nr:DUF1573 domain-containing protein [Bacteroidales bacterium]